MIKSASNDNEEIWFVYILECKGGRLYTGISNDVARRFDKHASGKGAMFTRLNKPIRVLAWNAYPNKSEAAKIESRLKKFPREGKLDWVEFYSKENEITIIS